ncbi:hypothetical protein LINGRAHAP2_LOCUS31811 [Linum grandiflorum]
MVSLFRRYRRLVRRSLPLLDRWSSPPIIPISSVLAITPVQFSSLFRSPRPLIIILGRGLCACPSSARISWDLWMDRFLLRRHLMSCTRFGSAPTFWSSVGCIAPFRLRLLRVFSGLTLLGMSGSIFMIALIGLIWLGLMLSMISSFLFTRDPSLSLVTTYGSKFFGTNKWFTVRCLFVCVNLVVAVMLFRVFVLTFSLIR